MQLDNKLKEKEVRESMFETENNKAQAKLEEF